MPFLTTLTCNICNEILRRECVASMRNRVPSFLYGRVWITHRRYHRQPNLFPHFFHGTLEELERCIRQLRSRIKKIAFAERGLTSALPDYVDTGQLSLPLDGGDAP